MGRKRWECPYDDYAHIATKFEIEQFRIEMSQLSEEQEYREYVRNGEFANLAGISLPKVADYRKDRTLLRELERMRADLAYEYVRLAFIGQIGNELDELFRSVRMRNLLKYLSMLKERFQVHRTA